MVGKRRGAHAKERSAVASRSAREGGERAREGCVGERVVVAKYAEGLVEDSECG